jgi:hypothetical protein
MERLEPCHLAGTWYAGTRATLERQTTELLAAASLTAPASGPVRGIIVPHAGYQYSGATAAAAYRAVQHGPYRRVLILAPSHRVYYRGAAWLDADGMVTPLGTVPVDRAAVAAISDHPLLRGDASVFGTEHSLEIQLPLLQRVLPGLRVVPLLLGAFSDADLDSFGEVLDRVVDEETLIVVSSDFTHYGASFDYLPFAATGIESVRTQLRALDLGAIEHVLSGDLAGFSAYLAATGATICGATPIRAFLAWHRAASRGALLAYTTSLDLTGDYEHSVSYAAIAFARPA